MKNLFVSSEKIVLRSYQQEPTFRLIGCIFLLAGFLQIPVLFFAGIVWKDNQAQTDRRIQLTAAANDLQAKLGNLKETRQKLAQIQQWEPVVKNRLPCSAVLAAIERAVPGNAVLERIAIEPSRFQVVPVAGGTYRVPLLYAVSIQGSLRFEARAALGTFSTELKKRLGLQNIRSSLLAPVDELIPFALTFSIVPTGNYSALGVQRIADPDRL
jgi:Tfp pilus assembly protein PilN